MSRYSPRSQVYGFDDYGKPTKSRTPAYGLRKTKPQGDCRLE